MAVRTVHSSGRMHSAMLIRHPLGAMVIMHRSIFGSLACEIIKKKWLKTIAMVKGLRRRLYKKSYRCIARVRLNRRRLYAPPHPYAIPRGQNLRVIAYSQCGRTFSCGPNDFAPLTLPIMTISGSGYDISRARTCVIRLSIMG